MDTYIQFKLVVLISEYHHQDSRVMTKEVTYINFSSSQQQSLVEDSRESIWLLTREVSRGEREVLFKPFGFRASLGVLLEFDYEFHKRSPQGRTGCFLFTKLLLGIFFA